MRNSLVLWGVTIAACSISSRGAALLSDDFSDGERATQNLPGSAAWYIGSANASAVASFGVTNNALTIAPQSVSPAAAEELAYFTTAGSPQSIAAGEQITITAKVTLPKVNGDRGLRIGVFNSSAGTRLAADQSSPNLGATDAYVGYTFDINPGTPTSATGTQITKRRASAGNQVLFGGSTNTVSGPAAATGTTAATINTSFPVSFTVTRDANGLTFSGSFNGGPAFTGTELTASNLGGIAPYTAFDTIAFFETSGILTDSNPANLAMFDDINVTFSTVPEPASLGLASFAGLATLRRRRRV